MTLKKVKLASNGNIKLGKKMGTWSKLMGNDAIYIDRLGIEVSGSCGKHCNGCKNDCYVKKSYRYPSVKYGHAINTLAMRLDLAKVFADLNNQLTRKRVPFEMVRINQSGELESVEEFEMWVELARLHPETKFYLYTKAYDIVTDTLLSGKVPANMTILVSVWHEYGVEEFKKLAHLENVKAFVYDDGFDYESKGIQIKTYCKAYDLNGKLDHNVTCDKCQKCFNRLSGCKVVGTYPH